MEDITNLFQSASQASKPDREASRIRQRDALLQLDRETLNVHVADKVSQSGAKVRASAHGLHLHWHAAHAELIQQPTSCAASCLPAQISSTYVIPLFERTIRT